MAKKFNEMYTELKAKVYNQAKYALVVAAAGNNAVNVAAILQPNGKVDGTTTQYNVQRRKRPGVNTVANATAGTTSAALAALDQFSIIDWDTVEVATGVLKSVGFKEQLGDDFDYSNSPKHQSDMQWIIGEQAEQRRKDIIALFDTFGETAAVLPDYTAGDTVVYKAINDEITALSTLDDEYKSGVDRSEFIIVVSQEIATELTLELGTAFQQEAPIAQTGFTSSMSIGGTPIIVETGLTGREVYMYDAEAIIVRATQIEKAVNIDLGLTAYTGKFFWDVMAVADTARVKQFKKTP